MTAEEWARIWTIRSHFALRLGLERLGDDRRVGQRLHALDLFAVEAPDVNERDLHLLARRLGLGLVVAEDDQRLALLDELVGRDLEVVPVLGDRRPDVLDDRVLAGMRTAPGNPVAVR